jgi:hypothetical protein
MLKAAFQGRRSTESTSGTDIRSCATVYAHATPLQIRRVEDTGQASATQLWFCGVECLRSWKLKY